MPEFDESFSSRLRAALAAKELSQAELARRCGIGRSTLSRIVHGRRVPNARELGAIAHELDLDLLEFIGVAENLTKLPELEQRASEAERRAEAAEAKIGEAKAAFASRAEELEMELAGLEALYGASENKCRELTKKLEEAEGQIALLEALNRDFEPPKRAREPERPFIVPAVVEDHYAPARRQAQLAGNVAGNIARLIASAWTFHRVSKKMDESF